MKYIKNNYLQKITLAGIACSLLLLTGLSGCSSSDSTPAATTVTISGKVSDTADVAEPGVAVEVVYTTPGAAGNVSTTTNASGDFSLTVNKNTTFYVRISKTDFATLNSEKGSTDVDEAVGTLNIPTSDEAQGLINQAFGLGAPLLANHAWLVVGVEDASGDELNGVTIASVPAETDEVYANCDGTDSNGGATTGAICPLPDEREGVQYIAYFDATADVTVTATSTVPPAADNATAPVRMGEIAFIDFEL